MSHSSVAPRLSFHVPRHPGLQPLCRLLSVLLFVAVTGCASTPWYDSPPPMPEAIGPQSGSTLSAGEPVEFLWTQTPDTEFYEFHVFNAQNSDIQRYMKTDLRPSDICDGAYCRVDLYLSLPASERHAWRVRSGNIAGKSAWTRSLFTFRP